MLKLLMHLCDGFQSPEELGEENRNFLGDLITAKQSNNLSFISGMAMSGTRAGAYLNDSVLSEQGSNISYAVKQHLPLVVHVGTSKGQRYESAAVASRLGAFCLFSSNAQEAIDLAIIAHRISELALVPAVHFLPADCSMEGADMLDDAAIATYLGSASSHIESPVPSQQWVFGPKRRTVPNWFSTDVPVLNGAVKHGATADLETLADKTFFQDHFLELAGKAFAEFKKLTGRDYAYYTSVKTADAETLLISYGTAATFATEAVQQLRDSGNKAGAMNLTMPYAPVPDHLTELITKSKLAVVIEPVSAQQTCFRNLQNAFKIGQGPKLVSVQFGQGVTADDLFSAVQQIEKGDRTEYYLNLDISRAKSDFPKHGILINNINRSYPEASSMSLRTNVLSAQQMPAGLDIPLSVRRFKDDGPGYASVSRFYNETGIFYRTGMTDQLVADPFQAVNSIPPSTSAFADMASERKQIPVFNTGNCRTDIDMAVTCPNAAMPTLSISLEALIRAGANMATAAGASIAKMTPVVKNLAKTANRMLASEDNSVRVVGDILPKAFEELAAKTKIEGEKYDTLAAELKTILEHVGSFSFAITDELFVKPETQAAGSGELFSVAFDSHACNGCGICTTNCKNNEISMVDQSKETLAEMEQHFSLWERLPDTPGDTITRLVNDPDSDPFAAIMLSRNFYLSMGGSRSENGSGHRTLLHMITSVAESVLQTDSIKRIKDIDELISKLKEQVHKDLSAGLPQADLSALQDALNRSDAERTPFNQIIEKVGNAAKMKLMDTVSLKRKLAVLRGLETIHWTLSEGPTGTGRARFGLAIHGQHNLEWAREYPFNLFSVPTVVHADSSTPEMVHGLIQGQRSSILANCKLIRRAELESKGKYNPVVHDEQIAGIEWDDLSIEEKKLLAPVILVADQTEIIMDGSWSGLLLSGFPIKLFVLNNGDILPTKDAPDTITRQNAMLLSAIGMKKAFVFQSGTADRNALFNGMVEGIRADGPAMFILNVPDRLVRAADHQTWDDIAEIGLKCRADLTVKFNPEHIGEFLSNGIDLSMNPDSEQAWADGSLSYLENGEEQQLDHTPTWADFAFTLKNWQKEFTPCPDTENAVDMATYLKSSADKRQGENPVISVIANGQLERYSASDLVADTANAVAEGWHTLQEIAGVLTPFPEKLHKQVEAEVKADYEQKLKKAQAELDARMKEKEAQQVELIRQRLKNNLVSMAKQGGMKA